MNIEIVVFVWEDREKNLSIVCQSISFVYNEKQAKLEMVLCMWMRGQKMCMNI